MLTSIMPTPNSNISSIIDYQIEYCSFSSGSNSSSGPESGCRTVETISTVLRCLQFLLGVPFICLAVVSLVKVRGISPTPVLSINLIISDIIQVLIRGVFIISGILYHTGATHSFCNPNKLCAAGASIGFCCVLEYVALYCMLVAVLLIACLSVDRYVRVIFPLWYHLHDTVTYAIAPAALSWIVAAVLMSVLKDPPRGLVVYPTVILLPVPLFLFTTFRILQELPKIRSLPVKERRILTCVTVLCPTAYILLFFPGIFLSFSRYFRPGDEKLSLALEVAIEWAYLYPVFNPIKHILLRRDVREIWQSSTCFCVREKYTDIIKGLR